jgi:Ca2+-binding EF-hand superfamily protein
MKREIIGCLAVAASLALSASGAQAQSPSEAERQLMVENLIEADANSDGALSRSEFEVLINLNAADNLGRAAVIVRTGRYDRAFSRIDANGDGYLSQSELQSMVEQAQG